MVARTNEDCQDARDISVNTAAVVTHHASHEPRHSHLSSADYSCLIADGQRTHPRHKLSHHVPFLSSSNISSASTRHITTNIGISISSTMTKRKKDASQSAAGSKRKKERKQVNQPFSSFVKADLISRDQPGPHHPNQSRGNYYGDRACLE